MVAKIIKQVQRSPLKRNFKAFDHQVQVLNSFSSFNRDSNNAKGRTVGS